MSPRLLLGSLLVAALLSPAAAFTPADLQLNASSRSYLWVDGDPAGGGVTALGTPVALSGLPQGNSAVSSISNARIVIGGNASSSDWTSASYGLLQASLSASTGGNANAEAGFNGATASFADAVTFYNANFAPGQYFHVRLTMSMDFSGLASTGGFARSYAVGQGGIGQGFSGLGSIAMYESIANAAGAINWHDPSTMTLDFSVSNGDTRSIWGMLTTDTGASAGGVAQFNVTGLRYSLSGIDPGLKIATASGYLYDAAGVVPEAPSAAQALLGLLLLAGLMRRRAD